MRDDINIIPEEGDVLECLHMEKESDVIPGTLGTVRRVSKDPLLKDVYIIYMNWENGSTLSLLSDSDTWRLISKKNLNEDSAHRPHEFYSENVDLFDYFDWRWFRSYLEILRDTGIVNMFGAAPFLYMGKEHLERYYGEGKEDDESFNELLELADTSRQKMVEGVVKYLDSTGKDWDLDDTNSKVKRFANKMVGLYWSFH